MINSIDKSPLASINSVTLIIGFLIVLLSAWLIAYYYRNSYQMNDILKSYGIFSILFLIIFLVLKVKIVLIIGMLLMGLVILGFRSNRYFYH